MLEFVHYTTIVQEERKNMEAIYTKLKNSGDWGIRIQQMTVTELSEIKVGSVVTVVKKSGEKKSETIEKMIWQGRDEKGRPVIVATIKPDTNPAI